MMAAPTLELNGIHKAFGGVKALSDVALCLYPGEVHTLMGQNGAGKSTLIKVLTGVYAPDSGEIRLDGRIVQPASTLEAQNLGISTVYQEVNLCPNLSVAENIFIGRYPRKYAGIDWKTMQQQAQRFPGPKRASEQSSGEDDRPGKEKGQQPEQRQQDRPENWGQ